MFGADKGTADKLDGRKLFIGIVQARFNERITNALAEACNMGLDLPGVTLARKLYDELAGRGLGRLGTQALYQLYSAGD